MPGTLSGIAQLYRPQVAKVVSLGNPVTPGGVVTVPTGAFDLSTPVAAIRLVFKGRFTIATAAYSSMNAGTVLNLLKRILLTGRNALLGGNVTLHDVDGATWFDVMRSLSPRGAHFYLSQAGGPLTSLNPSTTPYGATVPTSIQANDFIIVLDIPAAPPAIGLGFVPGYAFRNIEWQDTLQLQVFIGTITDNTTNSVGVSASTTVSSLTAFGSSTGNATLDVYTLPVISGVPNIQRIVSGVVSRAAQPLTTQVQTSGTNVTLLTLQKQDTARIYIRTGVAASGAAPAFASLSDSVLPQVGLVRGANRYVRNLVDIFTYKIDISTHYLTDPVQGLVVMDFLQGENPFSAYPGSAVQPGETLQLVANVNGAAGQQAIVVQEQILRHPMGLYAA
jgi:hypothetical protein